MMKNFKKYSIDFREKSFEIYLEDVKIFSFPVSSAVDGFRDIRVRQGGSDYIESSVIEDVDNTEISRTLKEENNEITAVYKTSSNLWQEKIYTISATEKGFSYTVRVNGEGTVNKIRYFSSAETPIDYEVAGYLLLHSGHYKKSECMRNVFENSQLSFDYFSPCPFVYPFYTEDLDGWFGIGLFAKSGEHNFDRFVYERGMKFTLPLNNRLVVNGEKELPGIWGGYGEDGLKVLSNYADWYYDNGLAKRHADYSLSPKWWKGPIFCGWGEQQKMGRESGQRAIVYSNQECYETMMSTLEKHGIVPRILIIDAVWQKGYGNIEVDKTKWPDMRGFVDKMHNKGTKVLLWIKSWDADGLPKDECIDLLCNPVASDPTNPKYRDRIKKSIKTLLSSDEGCCDCDGFKIDFMNCTPKGELLRPYKADTYGVELVRTWLDLVYNTAKSVKPDALINASCAHPYTADVCDQVRLHDYQGAMRSAVEVMSYRKEIANAVYPGITFDTDSGGTVSHRDFIRYIKAQLSIGVPDLYYVTSSFGTPMSDEDFELIKQTWDKYIEDNNL